MTGTQRTAITSGSGTAIIFDSALALIESAVDSPAAGAIENGLLSGRSLEEIVAELSMLGFASLPSFVLVLVTGSTTRLIHRGRTEVVVLDSDGKPTTFFQPSVSTWREEAIEDIVEIRASLRRDPSPDQPSRKGHWLVGTGVIAADAITWFPATPLTRAEAAEVDDRDEIVPIDAPFVVAVPVLPRVVTEEVEASSQLIQRTETEVPAAPEADPADRRDSESVAAIDQIVDSTRPPDRDRDGDVSEALLIPVAASRPENSPVAESFVAAPVQATPQVPGEADDLDFAHFVDHTVFRRAEDAAVRPVEPDESMPPAPETALDPAPSVYMSLDTLMPGRTTPPTASMIDGVPGPGAVAGRRPGHAPDADHDGHTVARPRRRSGAASAATPAAEGDSGVMVQSVFCAQGHPNPASASTCRSCGMPVTDRAARLHERPSLGQLRFSTGQSVSLVKPLLIGRNPPPSQKLDGHDAHIIEIDNSELSRLHAAVHLVEWHVHVDDQGSTNGTAVTLPGLAPQTLRPFEKVQISVGTVVDLGGAVSFSFDRA